MDLFKIESKDKEHLKSIIFFRIMVDFTSRLLSYMLPLMLIYMGWNELWYGLIYSVAGYASTATVFFLGYITDIRKRRNTLIAGIGLSVLSMAGFYFSTISELKIWMIGTYAFFGLAGSLTEMSLNTLLADISHSKDKKIQSFSLLEFFRNIGGVLAPLIGGIFLTVYTKFRIRQEAYLALMIIITVLLFLTFLFSFKFPIPIMDKEEVRKLKTDEEWSTFEKDKEKKSIGLQLGAFLLCQLILGFTSGVAIPFLRFYIIDYFAVSDMTWAIISAIFNLGIAFGNLSIVPMSKRVGNEKTLGFLYFIVPLLALGIALGNALPVVVTFHVLRGSAANMSRPAWNSFFYSWLPPEFRGRSSGLVSAGRRLARSGGTNVGAIIFPLLGKWTFPIMMLGYPVAILIPLLVQKFLKNNDTNSKKYKENGSTDVTADEGDDDYL